MRQIVYLVLGGLGGAALSENKELVCAMDVEKEFNKSGVSMRTHNEFAYNDKITNINYVLVHFSRLC